MKRTLGALVAVAALAAGRAEAQYYVQPRTMPRPYPTFSPYLNLGRGGNPALNYYGLVRPQFETQRGLQQLQTQLDALPGQPPVGEERTILGGSSTLPAIIVPTQSAKPVWTTARASGGTVERRRPEMKVPSARVRDSPMVFLQVSGVRCQVSGFSAGYSRSPTSET